jgi:hypothetical protein
VLPTSKRKVIFQFMNRPEFITKDSRIIISENNLKIVGLVTEPLFDTDKNQKMFTGTATPMTEKKRRRMSNQASDLYSIQSAGTGQETSVKASTFSTIANTHVGRFEETKCVNSRTPMRNPESIISDGEENASEHAKSEGRKPEGKSSNTKKPLKTALSLE